MQGGRWKSEARTKLLKIIKKKGFQRGRFVLASGKVSECYIDARRVTLDPEGAYLTARLFIEKLKKEKFDAVGGLTLGADPIVSSIAAVSFSQGNPISVFIIRKETKSHGTQKLIEGDDLHRGQRVVLVDDVLTTGGSLLEAAQKIQPLGVKIIKILCLVDRREKDKRVSTLEPLGVGVESLFTIDQIVQ